MTNFANAKFQFTCPSRSTTRLPPHRYHHIYRFNSRAPRGARQALTHCFVSSDAFQFTCPSRSTTCNYDCYIKELQFQFTCPSRSTTCGCVVFVCDSPVSIHVPLAEHDFLNRLLWKHVVVSIHVPLAEHDISPASLLHRSEGFNSRAPRGARHEHIFIDWQGMEFPQTSQFKMLAKHC